MKPARNLVVICGRPVTLPGMETPIQAAQRRHGKPFGEAPWTKGPSYWTPDRVARLAAMNEENRMRKQKGSK